MKQIALGTGLFVLLMIGSVEAAPKVLDGIDISKVWSGLPVPFALLTHGKTQYIAYYDDQRNMVVAQRELGQAAWVKNVLPTQVGWDSHNSIAMAMDDDGQLHLAGNMHAIPLIYFRTTKPGDVMSMQRVDSMVGRDEEKCTYPIFLRGSANELVFVYRSGSSGNGDQIYNFWENGQWHRMLDQPLTDGENSRNAYFVGPVRGPDGYFHLVWVWRESPDCATNHDLSYARSKDLRHWESADGKGLTLPIKLSSPNRVDPVPEHGGMINNNTKIGFDSKKRVIISYHKFDQNGNTQVYNARLEDGAWKIYQLTNWDFRWEFGGSGSIVAEVRVDGPRPEGKGLLAENIWSLKQGGKTWTIDEATLKVVGEKDTSPSHPAELENPETDFPGMQVNWAGDLGKSGEKGVSYWLRWETLPANRDRPREGILPGPTTLKLYKIGS